MLHLTNLPLLAAAWPERRAHEVPKSFDCEMRKAAYAFGQHLLPRLGKFESLYYALDLNAPDCHEELQEPRQRAQQAALQVDSIFVAPGQVEEAKQLEAQNGSIGAPFHCIQQAADVAAERGISRVVLRGGTYYLQKPIHLTARHSHLAFEAAAGERPVVSGGVHLTKLAWKAVNVTEGANIWAADVDDRVDDVPGLQLNGIRATRARYPNLAGSLPRD